MVNNIVHPGMIILEMRPQVVANIVY